MQLVSDMRSSDGGYAVPGSCTRLRRKIELQNPATEARHGNLLSYATHVRRGELVIILYMLLYTSLYIYDSPCQASYITSAFSFSIGLIGLDISSTSSSSSIMASSLPAPSSKAALCFSKCDPWFLGVRQSTFQAQEGLKEAYSGPRRVMITT